MPSDRRRIGARHDDELVVGARIDGGFHAVDHFSGRHDFLARPVAATLLADLVFQMHGRHARLDERTHGARDVECAAPAGVDVDEQRQVGCIGDAARVDQHVVHRADAEIGDAERIRRDAAARQVQRLEADRLGHFCGIGGDRADYLQGLSFRHCHAEFRAGTARFLLGSVHCSLQLMAFL